MTNTRAYQGRQGLHNRYPGDMIMATAMVAIGMTHPTAAARLLGKDWVGQTLLSEDSTLEFSSDEIVSGHPCRCIVVRDSKKHAVADLVIDIDLGVLRAWRSGDDQSYTSVQYDVIRLNPRLSPREFAIPEDARKKAYEKKD